MANITGRDDYMKPGSYDIVKEFEGPNRDGGQGAELIRMKTGQAAGQSLLVLPDWEGYPQYYPLPKGGSAAEMEDRIQTILTSTTKDPLIDSGIVSSIGAGNLNTFAEGVAAEARGRRPG